MSKSAKIILVLILLAALGLLVFKNRRQNSKFADNTFKIGTDFALTGSLAQYGEWVKNGVELAKDQINKDGIKGKIIEIIYEDNGTDPAKAVSAYSKLRNVDHVNYVLTFLSQVALAVENLTHQDHVIQMDVSATTPNYSSPDNFSFRTGIVATQLAKAAADEISSTFKVNKLAILYINNDFGKGMLGVFKNSYPGTIVDEEGFDLNTTDVRTQLLKLKNSGTQNLWLINQGNASGLIIKQAGQLNFKPQIFSDAYSIEGTNLLDVAKETANGIIYVAPQFDASSSAPAVADFAAQYKNRYHAEPNIFSAQAYDGLMALSYALKSCEITDTACVKIQLRQLDFPGASGRIKFDGNGDVQKNVELKTIKNGQFTKLKQ